MSLKYGGGSAFPSPHVKSAFGMTLRDYFAAKAISGLTANQDWMINAAKNNPNLSMSEVISSVGHGIADAMLAERAK